MYYMYPLSHSVDSNKYAAMDGLILDLRHTGMICMDNCPMKIIDSSFFTACSEWIKSLSIILSSPCFVGCSAANHPLGPIQ